MNKSKIVKYLALPVMGSTLTLGYHRHPHFMVPELHTELGEVEPVQNFYNLAASVSPSAVLNLEEQYWQNLVKPVAATMYRTLPYQYGFED